MKYVAKYEDNVGSICNKFALKTKQPLEVTRAFSISRPMYTQTPETPWSTRQYQLIPTFHPIASTSHFDQRNLRSLNMCCRLMEIRTGEQGYTRYKGECNNLEVFHMIYFWRIIISLVEFELLLLLYSWEEEVFILIADWIPCDLPVIWSSRSFDVANAHWSW